MSTPYDLIDIGANLTHDSFDPDRSRVIKDAQDAGVSRMILTGSTVDGSAGALALAKQWPAQLYSTAGVHPHHASGYSGDSDRLLLQLLDEPEVVAVGECGLDYFRNFSPAVAQKDAFQRQLELASRSGLPVFLHQRDAHDEFVEILRPMIGRLSRAVAHCFTGGAAELDTYLDMGLSIGITGWICDERRGAHLQEAVGRIPLDRLMIETDAPYLLPRTLRTKPQTRRNEPKYLPEVLRVVADAMQQDMETIAGHTTENAERFFGIGGR